MDVIFSEGTNKDNLVRPLLPYLNIPMCIIRSYNCVSIGKERLIPYQGKDSNSFFYRTLTKSSKKSMLNDQASQMTL